MTSSTERAASGASWSVPQPLASSAPGLSRAASMRAADQFQRGRPVQPHAALRGVHGLGHAQPHGPQVAPVGDGGVPVDGAIQPGVDGRARVGHHVGGRVRDAREFRTGCGRREGARPSKHVGLQGTVNARESKLHGGFSGKVHARIRRRRSAACAPRGAATGRERGGAQIASGGTSIQRRSRQLCSAASTSCTPLAPSGSVHL